MPCALELHFCMHFYFVIIQCQLSFSNWTEICDELQGSLVKIISLDLDMSADRICEISGALRRTGSVSYFTLTLSWLCLAHSDTHLFSEKWVKRQLL